MTPSQCKKQIPNCIPSLQQLPPKGPFWLPSTPHFFGNFIVFGIFGNVRRCEGC